MDADAEVQALAKEFFDWYVARNPFFATSMGLHEQDHEVPNGSRGTQLEEFLGHYNTARPHRALAGATPLEVWGASQPATPGAPIPTLPTARLLSVDTHGRISLGRYVIQIGTPLAGRQVLVLVRGHNVSIFEGGKLVHRLHLDPTRRYQPNGKPKGRRPKVIGPCQ